MDAPSPSSDLGLSPVTAEEIGRALARALGDERASALPIDAALVSSGIIGSLDLVTVAAELEVTFGVPIRDQDITVANFDSKRALLTLVAVKRGETVQLPPTQIAADTNSLTASARAVVKRPIAALAFTLCFIVFMDFALNAVMQGPLSRSYRVFTEQGQRLYPVSGGYAADDLSFAVSQHRIGGTDAAKKTIAVLGDSGTIGSWVRPQEAIPAQIETALRTRNIEVEVQNLAFFMQFLAKDLMILEAATQKLGGTMPYEAVVITLGDDYFSKSLIAALPNMMPYLPLNRHLLDRFADRLGPEGRDAARSMARQLETSASRHRTPVHEWLALNSSAYHYAPFFRYYVNTIPFLKLPNLNYNFEGQYTIGRRQLFSPVPAAPPAGYYTAIGLMAGDLDQRPAALLEDVVRLLSDKNIKVLLYLKPRGPREWQQFFKQQPGATSVRDIADRICASGRCEVEDLRWVASGSEFTDSVAHYSAVANERIGQRIAERLAAMLSR